MSQSQTSTSINTDLSSANRSEITGDHVQTTKPIPLLKLEVLRTIRISQQQHGLRHGDYQRYRSFCSRRLRRIRKSLEFTYGNQKKFLKPTITDDLVAKDTRYLLLPLMCSERAWAYAMQLKSESNTEPRKKFHLLSRLRKAVKYAEQLEVLCNHQKLCDARTKLEVQAYTAVMSGHCKFEMQMWDQALQYYIRAQTIYDNLKTGLISEDDKQMIVQRIEEITTNIRFCQYKSGDKNAAKELRNMRTKAAVDDPEMARILDIFLSETHQQQTATMSEIMWRNRKIQVKNDKVRLFFLNQQEFEDEIKKGGVSFDTKMSLYESFLKEAVETLQIVKDELKNDPTYKPVRDASVVSNEKLSDNVWLYSYISKIRLSKMIERNLAMIDNAKQQIFKAPATTTTTKNSGEDMLLTTSKKITKPADIVRMYDLLLQCLNDMSSIPALQDDKIFKADIEFQTAVYKACRSFYIAVSFVQQKRFKDSAALICKCESYMQQAKAMTQTQNSEINYQTLLNEFNFIQSLIDETKYQIQTSATTSTVSSPKVHNDEIIEEKDIEKKPLIDRLDIYYEDQTLANKNRVNVVSLPPPFKPIPCKPVLFDLALNHLNFPSLDDKVQSKRTQPTVSTSGNEKQQQGFMGFAKGLFSWSGKKQ
ncbi:unnamed protein product [Didymodactylos carnosus]|uniref:Signal recognition particle subunit SRP68 n=1 Tax=Didymodactylos carnosus TaxID=1234261 RepID=A0A814JLY0_9BILA|nr:unnamed protein product [Didymodactylos carnosus]CAF1041041.1 unnamed protein product [Didymodactylos carnosus]CAF3601107.1 unnamed protein product [Didymodactylos carnosus]CAF3811202.1 unnamed protein product [Didymodactylos carnosus]